ncbi:glutathione S-transferase family protein [Phenylobacterium sp.]|uniref:glutathione S-transferase family protein n=1 Tax=Phenylobacterium sp. TaxID=1871053 RepID=UPI0035B25E13
MLLYTNGFSPFARKVALALDYKGLGYEAVDGLAHANLGALRRVNPRGEVPTLVDGEVVVANSSHILAYLEERYPARAILPAAPAARAAVRGLERLYDTQVDAVVVTASLWTWAERDDAPPAGMMDQAQADIDAALEATEAFLARHGGAWAGGETPGIADFAMWPHLAALTPLGFRLDGARFPQVAAWLKHAAAEPLFAVDARRTAAFLKDGFGADHEKRSIAWRGDRLEWVLARGHHHWLVGEIEAGRVIWPLR